MLHAITPSAEKLESKGIQSVRQRITLLKDYTDVGLEDVKTIILKTLCDDELSLSGDAVQETERIERQYHEKEFIHLI
jgi:lipoic acid synthetase/lipoate-protein ligase A